MSQKSYLKALKRKRKIDKKKKHQSDISKTLNEPMRVDVDGLKAFLNELKTEKEFEENIS